MLDQAYSRRQFLGLAGGLASIVGLGLVGCGGSNASDAADKGSAAAAAESVSGEVTYDGASSFQALVEAAAEKFMDANPDVSVSGSGNGSGKGLTAVAAGTVTIGNSDVFAETKLKADQVKNLVDHEVAVVGMGPVVSKNVKVDDLSLEQLKGIFSGQITNWKEVGGDDATIVVLNRKAGSGTRATFEATVFGDETVDFKGDAELDKSGDVQTQRAAPTTPSPTSISRTLMTPSSTPSRSRASSPRARMSPTTPSRSGLPSTCTALRMPTRPPRPSWSSCFPMTSRASSSRSRALSPSLP